MVAPVAIGEDSGEKNAKVCRLLQATRQNVPDVELDDCLWWRILPIANVAYEKENYAARKNKHHMGKRAVSHSKHTERNKHAYNAVAPYQEWDQVDPSHESKHSKKPHTL